MTWQYLRVMLYCKSYLVWTVVNGVCADTASVTLRLKNDGSCLDLDLPTGFTPNSDTYNDDYDIHGIENYPKNTFIVFNRWGNVVYEKSNYNNEWRGQGKGGEDLPNGTYFVVFSAGAVEFNTYVDLRR